MWQIVINGPGYFDTAYDLPEGKTTLGRSDENDVVLSGDLVSREHAALTVRQGALTFQDLASRNGSRVNGQAAKEQLLTLRPGDLLTLGENTLSVRLLDPAAPDDGKEPDLETDVRSSIILSKAVSETFIHRALDNVPPARSGAKAPSSLPDVDGPGGFESAYESLLLISRVAELLAMSDSLPAFLGPTLDLLMAATGAFTGVVLVRDSISDLKAAVIRHPVALEPGEVPVSRAIVDTALQQGEALVVEDVRGDPRFAARESVLAYAVGQLLCIPLGRRRPFEGALYLNRPGISEGLESMLALCTSVAHLLAAGIEKHSPRETPSMRARAAVDRALPLDPSGARQSKTGAGTQLERGMSTVLFADLSGFSGVTRRLEPPQVAELLQRFYLCFERVVWGFEGAVVSFVGDSALAVFGGAAPKRDDATRALRAALSLRRDWHELAEGEECGVKAGLHTGPALLGTISTDRRADYIAVGDPVNTAAWLVGLAGPDQILMTGKTLSSVGERFEVERLGERTISGRQKLTVYEVKAELVRTKP
jgi:class 3 adenylate cyclase